MAIQTPDVIKGKFRIGNSVLDVWTRGRSKALQREVELSISLRLWADCVAFRAYDGELRIGLLSDTHGFLDDAVFRHFAECDEVWHAGDFGTSEILDRLRAFKPIRGVYGNVDGADLRADLPEDVVWECEGARVYMTHIGGYPGNYDRRTGRELRRLRPGLFICGHSHILKVMRDPALGLLHMNPGACGHQGWHLVRTMLRFTVEAGKLSAVEAIELGPRGRRQTISNRRAG